MKNIAIRLTMLVLLCSILFSCKKSIDYSKASTLSPDNSVMSGEYDLNFVDMHNFVVDSLQSEITPFFYIVNNKFDISGDNKKRLIEVKCTCMDGTIESDVNLFFSIVLNYMSINASEQDYRFKSPSVSADGTYLDFGTLFDDYDLKLFANTESGEIISDVFIKKGDKIPIESKYIKES